MGCADGGSGTATDVSSSCWGSTAGCRRVGASWAGAPNPEPVKGRYDLGAMNRRIGFMCRPGATPVITPCCSPDRMKGGRPGVDDTNWSQAALETALTPDHCPLSARSHGVDSLSTSLL
ncbi:hypothetical protein GCM10010121_010980 [Streptomyces brasiliensis]|uniref:Uncharacterized protein n=1 Tax=Streptomyces brasiliensis TaxID=1954 RepID=A0A917NI83_9ACTN|nr:hypothetical protein GCM10010121_010980 [Streptomyces brasiliensis]